MKKLIAKIREILRNRRVRKLWTRTVSSIACLVVFVTTYALVLPAITMESQASCGIEAHQHDDSCYEERLTCTIPESEGHTHTEDCYSTKQKLICDRSEHEHNSDCYDENGNLTCSLEEHQHGKECFEDTRELVCGLEEAEGHHHDSSCYEKILTCGKEAHTHSQACYREDAASAVATEHAAVTATTTDSGDGNAAADVNGADGSSDDFETLDPAQTPSEGNVPAPDELNLQQPLNSDAAISNDSPAVDETRGSGNSDAGIISDDSSSVEENITEAVEETHPAVSFEDTLTVYTGSLGSDITGSLSSDTNAGNPGNDAAGSPDTDTAAGTFPASSNLTVSVSAEAGTFPAGTTMVLSAVTDMDAVAEAVEGTVDSKTRGFQAVDISFRDKDSNEIEPLKPISVTMRSDSIKAATEDSSMAPVVVHVEDRNKETAEATDSPAATVIETLPDTAENKEQSETPDVANSADAISFEADAFSVYAIVYTVDFHWGVNGKTYDFSIPGGGFVSLTDLVEVLDIIGDTNSVNNEVENGPEIAKNADESGFNEGTEENSVNYGTNTALTLGDVAVSDAAKEFVADVASVEFSDPKLVDISKVESETTVGQIKERRGLEIEYSANLKEEQISEINAQAVEAGDWALISVQPFTSEETLTVTMKNGEAFTLKVTDKQISTMYLSDSGKLFEVTVTYGEEANIPEGSTLRVTEFSEEDEEYAYARNSVLADKKARGEWVDLSSFGLAAMDISILNPDGDEIEPNAPVQVDIRIKELPNVEDLNEVADSLAIQHHVEVEDGVVVETVFNGNTEASFKLEINEIVAAEGIVIDPESVSDEVFANPDTFTSNSGEDGKSDEIDVSFQTSVFSTFTVTWGESGTTGQIRVSGLSNGKYILYAKDAKDASDSKYYALVPGTELNSVPVTLNNNNVVQYSGSENLYWDVETSGSGDNQKIYFSFTQSGTKYYLAAGTTGNYVTTSTNQNGYGNASTTEWRQWNNNIHSAQHTFLQSYDGTFRTWNVLRQSNWENRSQIYFEKENSVPHATIHYVDSEGNELTVSNGQPVNDTTTETYYNGYERLEYSYTYLIYDVKGYDYSYTYRNTDTNENRITPILAYRNNKWKYTSGKNTVGANNTWEDLSSNDEIYVVYEKKTDIPEGGTPKPKINGEKPQEPMITKSSVVNGDGTNTLALTVSGHTTDMEAEKLADVIVVFDISGSMNNTVEGKAYQYGDNWYHKREKEWSYGAVPGTDGYWYSNPVSEEQSRMYQAKEATNSLAEKLLGKNTAAHPNLIRMSLISFSNTAEKKLDFTTDTTTFQNTVNTLPSPVGGTNWEKALQLANEMAVESDRATFIVFVTDGDPTFRQTRGVLNNGGEGNLGDEDISDYYFQYNVYGTGNSDKHGRNFDAALEQAESIVNHKKNFYTIGISSDVTNLTKLTTQAGAGADHSKTATSDDELVAAFNDIATSIVATLGHSDIKISDGITDLTQTVEKSDLVNFAEDNFTYYKGKIDRTASQADVDAGFAQKVGDPVILSWKSWDPASEKCSPAVYNKTSGAVEWNMGEQFMPEDGYSYQVRFKVWPSQKAYDLLADLNNGRKEYSKLDPDEKAQIKEPVAPSTMYTLKTNSDTSYTYREATLIDGTVTPVGNDSEPGKFDDVDPLELTTRPLKVQKKWKYNYVDSRQVDEDITLELYGVNPDGTQEKTFKTIDLSGETETPWYSDNNYVSYGLLTIDKLHPESDTTKIYETGHDFTLREIGINAHYYELEAGIFRPMVINGTPTILELVEAPEGMNDTAFYFADGMNEYYRLDGKIYRNTQSDVLMLATNTHRSYMDLTKQLSDNAISDEEFEYEITFSVPENIDNFDDVEKYIWFSVYDPVSGRTLSPEEYTYTGATTPGETDPENYGGEEYKNYLFAISDQKLTLKIKQGWNVRFLNLATGTKYTFKEINIPQGNEFESAVVSGTVWNDSSSSAVEMTNLPSNKGGNDSSPGNVDTSISGTIEMVNARYKTTYTNKVLTQKITILKTDQDGTTPLQGAIFSLYTASGYAADPQTAIRTGLTSDKYGLIQLGELAVGEYKLVETKAPDGYNLLEQPVTITVNGDQTVSYNQPDHTIGLSGKGVAGSVEEGYKLTVINNAGYELPSTGGPGTRLFTILGSFLILGAGALMWRIRRFI